MKILNAILISSILFSQINCAQREQRDEDRQEKCCGCNSKLCNYFLCYLLLCSFCRNVRHEMRLEDDQIRLDRCEDNLNHYKSLYYNNYCAICPRSLKECRRYSEECERDNRRIYQDLYLCKSDLEKVKKEKLKKD